MNHANVDSNRMDWHRRIALVLRKEPGLVRDFAERLRSKWATRSAAVVSDNEWEWYIILILWSPQQVIRLLEDSAVRLRENAPFVSLLTVSLVLIASSNRPRYSDIGDMGRRNGVWEELVSCDPMLIFWLTHMSACPIIVSRNFHQLE
jgi:hypothetical protein